VPGYDRRAPWRARSGTSAASAPAPQTPEPNTRTYLAHLLGVASLVLEDGGDEEEAVAALLHDAVEDRGGVPRLEDIRLRFGDRVARIVNGCSDAAPERGKQKADWWTRKADYLRHLDQVDPDISEAVLRVSMADKLYNLRATVRDARPAQGRDEFWGLFKTGASGQLCYYRALCDIYQEKRPRSVLLPELQELVSQIAELMPPKACDDAATDASRLRRSA
jgi:(p)ppGpp synthase/HD superfamily hydrolase